MLVPKRMLTGTDLYSMVVVGVDPGPRPGIAVLGDGEVVHTEQVCIPEEAAARIKAIHKLYPAKEFVVRVGHGDQTKRNRIINALAELNVPIEIVDEKGTTDHIEAPDIHAAINIARETGHKVVPPLKVQPTEGELKDIMRRSRLKGDGRITISQELAELVAKGDMTLEDAVAEQAARHLRKRKGQNGKNGKSDG